VTGEAVQSPNTAKFSEQAALIAPPEQALKHIKGFVEISGEDDDLEHFQRVIFC
jgi:hypothetical protein